LGNIAENIPPLIKSWGELGLDSEFSAFAFDEAIRKLEAVVDAVEGGPALLFAATFQEMDFDGIINVPLGTVVEASQGTMFNERTRTRLLAS
jgi:hypothetical protein